MEENKFGNLIQLGFLAIKVLVVVFATIGSVQLFKAVFKTVVFDEYPINSYEMTAPSLDGKTISRSEKEIAISRKLQMLEDYSGAISMILVSGGLFWLGKKAR